MDTVTERPGPLVEVEWLDSATKHGWNDKEDVPTAADLPCLSAGYLVTDEKDHIVLVFGAGRGEYLCSQLIPRGMVQRIVEVAK